MKLITLISILTCMFLACKEPKASETLDQVKDTEVEAIVKAGTESATVAVKGSDSEYVSAPTEVTSPPSSSAEKNPPTKTLTKRTPPANNQPSGTEASVKKASKAPLKSSQEKVETAKEKIVAHKEVSTPDHKIKDKPTKSDVTATKKEDIIAYEPEPDPTHKIQEKPTKKKADKVHEAFDALLIKNVTPAGKVDYKGFKSEIRTLNSYLQDLSEVQVSTLKDKEQLAFWINAYNAFTIKKILDNYPVKSITDLDGGKPWDVKWIKLNNQTLSLNDIENVIIRPTFKEARIHFAVNCAAKSCPPLMNKAWTSANMEASFEKQTRAFINSAENSISSEKVVISKIFDWYGEDFGDLIGFLQKYTTKSLSADTQISFKDYDWSLNN